MIKREEMRNREKEDSQDEDPERRHKTAPRLSLQKTVVVPIDTNEKDGAQQRGAPGGSSQIQVPSLVLAGPSQPGAMA